MRNHTLRPRIVVGRSEHRQLMTMAAGGSSAAAEMLLEEMERARVVADADLPYDSVKMGSRVHYRTGDDVTKEVTLVYPSQADISHGKISVLTPVGAALIGLRSGQSITWTTPDGAKHVLTVIAVIQLADVA